MSEILGDKLNIVYEDTLLEITPELMKKTILNQNKEIERLNNKVEELMELYTTERHCKDDYKAIIKEVREWLNKTIFYFDFEKDVTSHTFELLYTAQGQELSRILDQGE